RRPRECSHSAAVGPSAVRVRLSEPCSRAGARPQALRPTPVPTGSSQEPFTVRDGAPALGALTGVRRSPRGGTARRHAPASAGFVPRSGCAPRSGSRRRYGSQTRAGGPARRGDGRTSPGGSSAGPRQRPRASTAPSRSSAGGDTAAWSGGPGGATASAQGIDERALPTNAQKNTEKRPEACHKSWRTGSLIPQGRDHIRIEGVLPNRGLPCDEGVRPVAPRRAGGSRRVACQAATREAVPTVAAASAPLADEHSQVVLAGANAA